MSADACSRPTGQRARSLLYRLQTWRSSSGAAHAASGQRAEQRLYATEKTRLQQHSCWRHWPAPGGGPWQRWTGTGGPDI